MNITSKYEQVPQTAADSPLSIHKMQRRSHRFIYICASAIFAVVVLTLGLGLGLALTRHSKDDDGQSSSTQPSASNNNWTIINQTVPSNIWQPHVKATWNYQLLTPVNLSTISYHQNESMYFDVWGFDLFDNQASTIAGLQGAGSKVICYFSAGSYEPNRPDSGNFSKADLGNELHGWPGERWLNISSPTVREIMANRIQIAAAKGCNGIDPDNMDGYSNDNGLGLTGQDTVDFVAFLADQAHSYNLSIGLKNSQAVIPNVLSVMQWNINEQCSEYRECSSFSAFINASKPVFNVEYPKGDSVNNDKNVTAAEYDQACDDPDAVGFSKIIKNILLDTWIERCP